MQNDPPKKKKKFVPLKNAKQSKQDIQQKSRFVQKERTQSKALERSRFDYTFQEIINHLLARLLPDSNFTIKLSQKLIFGEEKALDAFVAKLDNNIKYTTGLVIQLKEGKSKDDIDYKLAEQYKAKIFNCKLIQMSVKTFFDGTKYQREYFTFLGQFKNPEFNRIYVRLSKFYVNDFLVAIEEQGAIPQSGQQVQEKPRRGNRTRFKVIAESVEVAADEIDIEDVMRFFSRSDKLSPNDIQVQQNKNQFGNVVTYTISLKCYQEEKETKLLGFRYYFKHENFIQLPLKDSTHKTELCDEYGQLDQMNIKIRMIKGYKSSRWDQKNLLYKIRMDQIPKKKSNYNNQYFEAFHLVGVLPTVKELMEELQHRINQVPLEDLKQEIFIEFEDKIKDHIRNQPKVEEYIEKFIKQYLQKNYSRIFEVQSVKFPIRGVKVNLKIKRSEEQNFNQIQKNISYTMPKHIVEQKIKVDFSIDEQFLKKLEEAQILIIEHQERQFTFISCTDQLADINNKIQKILREFQSLGEQCLDVFGLIKKSKYMEVINNLKQKSPQFNQIFVPQPIVQDKTKFKIMFYGPRKKNDAFFEEVKLTIEKMESQLGQYCEIVDDRQATKILQDLKFQQQVQKKYKITLATGQFQFSARLQVGRSELSIVKHKNLERVPLGFWIYFDSKKRISQFKQKYLEKFKVIVNRSQKKQWIEYYENTRNYRLLFKQAFQIEETLKDSLNQQRKSTEDPFFIALLMPKENKNKWVQSLLKILTANQQFASQRFNILIIQEDKDENILKVVDLPQYTQYNSSKIQVQVEWSCEKLPYNKSANTKINDAVANRLNEVILSKQDIFNQNFTHICDLTTNTIQFFSVRDQRHREPKTSTQPIPFKIQKDYMAFELEGHVLKFPQQEYNKVLYNKNQRQTRFYLKMPFYKIDLTSMQQINIFSQYRRKIHKIQVQIAQKNQFDGVKAFYHQKKTQLIYTCREQDQKNLVGAAFQVCNYLKTLWVKEQIAIKQVNDQNFKKILQERVITRAQQFGFKYKLNNNLKSIMVQSLYERDIHKFKALIDNQSTYLINLSKTQIMQIPLDIKYPEYWEPQINEIQSFPVNKNTKQFIDIQSLFKLAPIYSLTRIQNKIIYKNYKDQVNHLTYMNNGKIPKQMKLFHGTGQTPAEVIWGDKEDGFNINYSGDNNLLGRGIYFAESSQYSHYYAKKEIQVLKALKGMFLCQVLVGDSQQMKMSSINRDVRGTDLKPNGLRYESMKGKHHICDIFVVYKNRRAYPLYYIRYEYK